jgi:hypothetical protein
VTLSLELQTPIFLRAAKNRLADPSEISAFEFKGNFDDLRFRWFRRLSTSIGRFSLTHADPIDSSELQKDRHKTLASRMVRRAIAASCNT